MIKLAKELCRIQCYLEFYPVDHERIKITLRGKYGATEATFFAGKDAMPKEDDLLKIVEILYQHF